MENDKVLKGIKDSFDDLMEIHGYEILEAYSKAESGKLSIGLNVTLSRAENNGVEVKVKLRCVKERIDGSAGITVSNQTAIPFPPDKKYKLGG